MSRLMSGKKHIHYSVISGAGRWSIQADSIKTICYNRNLTYHDVMSSYIKREAGLMPPFSFHKDVIGTHTIA